MAVRICAAGQLRHQTLWQSADGELRSCMSVSGDVLDSIAACMVKTHEFAMYGAEMLPT